MKKIEGQDYTGFIDYDRDTLRRATVNAKILWLEYRVGKVLIDPLDQLFPPNSPCHQTVNQGDRTFNLCGVTLVACAIEGHGHFLTGHDRAGDSFRDWLKKYMAPWDATTANGTSVVEWLWTSTRNGLAHQLGFKSGGTDAHSGQRFFELPDGQIEIDPFIFYDDFKAGVARFFNDLKNAPAMQNAFNARFTATFL
jgi:hypothetical protein